MLGCEVRYHDDCLIPGIITHPFAVDFSLEEDDISDTGTDLLIADYNTDFEVYLSKASEKGPFEQNTGGSRKTDKDVTRI